MPSFRSPEKQARNAVTKLLELGAPRHANKKGGKVNSLGRARVYEQALAQVAKWQLQTQSGSLKDITIEQAREYLEMRSLTVRQSTLDADRQALQAHLTAMGRLTSGQRLAQLKSDIQTVIESRAYTPEQVMLIAQGQSPKNALASEIALNSGLRAAELHTLRPLQARPPSQHREWRNDRFAGRTDFGQYTVDGKGGLVRVVAIRRDLAERLEARRLPEPQRVTDRKIHRETWYDIGGGNAWSASFDRVSKVILGWGSGGHGLRHSYAQGRIDELQGSGFVYRDALAIVSQELGHFRPEITEVYLR